MINIFALKQPSAEKALLVKFNKKIFNFCIELYFIIKHFLNPNFYFFLSNLGAIFYRLLPMLISNLMLNVFQLIFKFLKVKFRFLVSLKFDEQNYFSLTIFFSYSVKIAGWKQTNSKNLLVCHFRIIKWCLGHFYSNRDL